MKSFIH